MEEVPAPGPLPRYEIPGWREELGVVAGITGRGTDPDPGFDLGLWTDQPVSSVMGRWREFRRAEPAFHATVMAHQVHGPKVLWHDSASGWTILEGADGHATGTPGVMLAVTVADCVPIYLVDPVRRAVALLHAGWRGTAAGILRRGIGLLETRVVSRVENLVMHMGVAICGQCYEVGDEVLMACGQPVPANRPYRIDLREVLRAQAIRLGVEKISTSRFCSAHDGHLFFSHRASGGRGGRMVAYVGMLPGRGRS